MIKRGDIELKIKETLNERAENISLYNEDFEVMRRKVNYSINSFEEEKNMKKFSFKKIAVVVGAICILGSVTAIASGIIAGTEAHTNIKDKIKDYEKVSKLEEKAGFEFDIIESFDNGYRFDYAVPVYSNNIDEDGNKTGDSWIDVSVNYKNEKYSDVSLTATKNLYEEGTIDENEDYKGTVINYSYNNYMFVPPTYELTAEEQALVDSGELVVSYGTDEVEHKVVENVYWVEDNVKYMLTTFNNDMGKDILFDMAKEMIDAE